MLDFHIIKTLIDQWDPIKLLCCHAPPDEYDYETREILAEVNQLNEISVIELSEIIYHTFEESFGTDVFKYSIDECFDIAEAIISKDSR